MEDTVSKKVPVNGPAPNSKVVEKVNENKKEETKKSKTIAGGEAGSGMAVISKEGHPAGGFGGITFSQDGKAVLAIWLNKVEVMSSLTGKRLVSLEGHTAAVSALALHPINVSQVFTASFDGTLRLWDISDGAPVKLWNLGQPLLHIAISSDGQVAYATLLKSPDLSNPRAVSYVHRIELGSGKQQRWLKAKRRAAIALSGDGEYLLAVAKRELLVLRGSREEGAPPPTPTRLQHARNVVIVAVHPTGQVSLSLSLSLYLSAYLCLFV
jgi:WD40 repeat protein